MKERILKILNEIDSTIDYEKELALIDDELLDSFSIMSLVALIMEEFDIELDADDVTPENLNNLESIAELIKGKLG